MTMKYANLLRLALENATIDAQDSDTVTSDDLVDVSATPAETEETSTDSVIDVSAEETEETEETEEHDSEEEEQAPMVAVSADEVIVDTTDSLEEALVEVSEAEDAVEETEEQLETLEESAAGLESIRELLLASKQSGGLTVQAAKAATLAVEAFAKPCGIDTPIMASLENFGGNTSRLKATTISLESIADKIKSLWEAIWKVLVDMKNRVVEFIKRVFTATGRLKARGQKLVDFKTTGTSDVNTIKIKGLAKRIAVGTTVNTKASKGLESLVDIVKASTIVDGELEKAVADLNYLAKNAAAGKVTEEQLKAVKPISLSAPGYVEKDGVLSTPVLPGNVSFEVKIEKAAGPLSRFYVHRVTHEANISDDAVVPRMIVAEINATGQAVLGLYNEINAATKKADEASNNLKKFSKLPVDNKLTKEQAKMLKPIIASYRSAVAAQGQLTSKVCAHAVGVAAAYVQIAEKSAATYKSK